ncbi:uncharacterized protein [Rutidosis leptorrhynchoides]|uniref:uncharacterized protein n=1 Tax=Rutidosis leptorrhynchoides TaxID=125765 RepID=UPI003A99E4C6
MGVIGSDCYIVNVYGPHEDRGKQRFWSELSRTIDSDVEEAWVLCGDFNEVRCESERFNCDFVESRAKKFNKFIIENSLIDLQMSGRCFTRVSGDGLKYSKLDRFLVSEKFLHLWHDISAGIMERHLFDHCAIFLKDEERNFGPKPFKIFDPWLDESDIEDIIKNSWNKEVAIINRKDYIFRNRLKNVKEEIIVWSRSKFNNLDGEIELHKSVAHNLELKAETIPLIETDLAEWRNSRKKWFKKENVKTSMLRQKARVKWVLEEDENSKYFHSIVGMRNNKNTLRGLSINGMWNDTSFDIKEEAVKHFANRFKEVDIERPSLEELNYPSQ